ncbi:MAG: signal recognition particle protein, partial [Deltaproteobacteria bacterium]|nr:signal recognition particle protein [Deltaproteobacteria bacterium]
SVVDEKKAEEDARKLLSGRFNMKDFVEQIRTVRKMGPLKDLLEKFPLFGEMTEQLNPDERELGKIEAMYNSMTEKERLDPSLINDSRADRIARGAGRKKEEVRELLQKFGAMQQVMGAIGQNPGLLGRIPGFQQLGQLSRMKDMDLGKMFGGDSSMMQAALGGGMPGMPGMGMPGMQMPQFPPGYTPPMSRDAMARARLMGYAPGPQAAGMSKKEKDALKEKRKRERQAKKKNRRK